MKRQYIDFSELPTIKLVVVIPCNFLGFRRCKHKVVHSINMRDYQHKDGFAALRKEYEEIRMRKRRCINKNKTLNY